MRMALIAANIFALMIKTRNNLNRYSLNLLSHLEVLLIQGTIQRGR